MTAHDSIMVAYGVCEGCGRAQISLTKEGGSEDGECIKVCMTDETLLHVAAFLMVYLSQHPDAGRMKKVLHGMVHEYIEGWPGIGPAPEGGRH